MAEGIDSSSNPTSEDPYSQLGLKPGATFDEVQQARERKLREVGDDLQARARVEASYDALLMESLKERQLGKVSNAAASASLREESNKQAGGLTGSSGSLLTRLRFNATDSSDSPVKRLWPELALPEGQGLFIRLAFGFLAIVLLLVAPDGSIDLILALSTIGLFVSQIRRGRRPLPSLGWSVVTLSIGLILGGLLISGAHSESGMVMLLTVDQLEALPAVVLIWLGALLLA